MAIARPAALLGYIRKLVAAPAAPAVTDRELLKRFVQQRDDAAFADLVQRHGPMVLQVCRNLLHNGHDAEDAFQATFLVLARKAVSLCWQASIADWLHQVAYRVALKARTEAARRRARERVAEARAAS
jgi:DNA-directed RNA polymerase specialized sigma24 family protein